MHTFRWMVALLGLWVAGCTPNTDDYAETPDASTSETLQVWMDTIVSSSDAVEPNEVEPIPDAQPLQAPARLTFALSSITEHLQPTAQTFWIDPDQDEVIEGAQGTRLLLPANALRLPNGSIPTGPVKVTLQECYSLNDMIGYRLSTSSGDKILETAGMVHISVTSQGQALTLSEGVQYALYFPKGEEKPGMQLFYGNRENDGSMDWELAGTEEDVVADQPRGDWMPTGRSRNIDYTLSDTSAYRVAKVYINAYTSRLNKSEVQWRLKVGNERLHSYVLREFKAPEALLEAFKKQDSSYVRIDVRIQSNGTIHEAVVRESSLPELDQLLIDFLDSIPALNMERMGIHSENAWYQLGFSCKQVFDVTQYRKKFREKYTSSYNNAITQMGTGDLNYYMLQASRFGWINCDRFYNSPEKRVEFTVEVPEAQGTRVLLAFEDINSMLEGQIRGDRIVFPNVPENQSVRIIGLHHKNGVPTLGIAETTTGEDVFALNSFQPFTLTDLDAALTALDEQ